MSLALQLSTWLVLGVVWAALRGEERLQRPRWGIIALWCVVAVPSLLQFAVPGMVELGRRESAAVLDGQWWRLVTSIVLQDGGWYGTAFNLGTLAVTLLLVQVVVRTRTAAALFVVGGVVGNVLTVLTFGGTGAGNSMATLFLGVTVLAMARDRGSLGLVALAVVAVVAVVMLLVHDVHGLALAAALLAVPVLARVR